MAYDMLTNFLFMIGFLGVHFVEPNANDLADKMQEQSAFLHKVATLRPHMETFVDMLTEAKQKVRALPPEDNRVYVYKYVQNFRHFCEKSVN